LNALGTRIVDLIDGKRSITEIAGLIEEEYDVPAEEARRDLDEFLRTLSEAGALGPA
jgi:hypothetical protein